MQAATTPLEVVGRTIPRTTSQRVAPRAPAPSFSSAGTDWKRSREIEAMIGITMIVRIRLAVKTLSPVVSGVPKIGRKPSVLCRNGSTWACTNGARTSRPQKPRMTLGIAASNSTSGPTTPRTPWGPAGSGRARSRSRSGAPRMRAKAEVTAVPNSSEPAPNSPKLGCQVVS